MRCCRNATARCKLNAMRPRALGPGWLTLRAVASCERKRATIDSAIFIRSPWDPSRPGDRLQPGLPLLKTGEQRSQAPRIQAVQLTPPFLSQLDREHNTQSFD